MNCNNCQTKVNQYYRCINQQKCNGMFCHQCSAIHQCIMNQMTCSLCQQTDGMLYQCSSQCSKMCNDFGNRYCIKCVQHDVNHRVDEKQILTIQQCKKCSLKFVGMPTQCQQKNKCSNYFIFCQNCSDSVHSDICKNMNSCSWCMQHCQEMFKCGNSKKCFFEPLFCKNCVVNHDPSCQEQNKCRHCKMTIQNNNGYMISTCSKTHMHCLQCFYQCRNNDKSIIINCKQCKQDKPMIPCNNTYPCNLGICVTCQPNHTSECQINNSCIQCGKQVTKQYEYNGYVIYCNECSIELNKRLDTLESCQVCGTKGPLVKCQNFIQCNTKKAFCPQHQNDHSRECRRINECNVCSNKLTPLGICINCGFKASKDRQCVECLTENLVKPCIDCGTFYCPQDMDTHDCKRLTIDIKQMYIKYIIKDTDDVNTKCSICFEKCPSKTLYKCQKHWFHVHCIRKWISDNDQTTCPTCRTDYELTQEVLYSFKKFVMSQRGLL